jgi:hypothetical protein
MFDLLLLLLLLLSRLLLNFGNSADVKTVLETIYV